MRCEGETTRVTKGVMARSQDTQSRSVAPHWICTGPSIITRLYYHTHLCRARSDFGSIQLRSSPSHRRTPSIPAWKRTSRMSGLGDEQVEGHAGSVGTRSCRGLGEFVELCSLPSHAEVASSVRLFAVLLRSHAKSDDDDDVCDDALFEDDRGGG